MCDVCVVHGRITESRVFILKAFRLTLFKRIRQKLSENVK